MGLNFSSPSSGVVTSYRNGHVYTSIVTQDNARAHYGDKLAVSGYIANYSLWPLSSSAKDAKLPCPEQKCPKRKRIQDADVEVSSRQGQNPVDVAIDCLGQLHLSVQHSQKDLQDGLISVNRVSINSAPNSRRTVPTLMIEVKRKSSVIFIGRWQIRLDTVHCDSVDSKGREVNESFASLGLKLP